MSGLIVEIQTDQIVLRGEIDQDILEKLNAIGEASQQLHLGQIRSMSSMGANFWVQWTRSARHAKHVLSHVPACMIRVANVIPEVLPSEWRLDSFYVPYRGVQDQEPEDVLFVEGKQFTKQQMVLPPTVSSQVDGRKMEIDVHPARYFEFLLARYPGLKISELTR